MSADTRLGRDGNGKLAIPDFSVRAAYIRALSSVVADERDTLHDEAYRLLTGRERPEKVKTEPVISGSDFS